MDMRGQSQRFPPKRGKFLASKLLILTEKGVFLGPNIREKGLFSKLENADMSSFIVLSEGAGTQIQCNNHSCPVPFFIPPGGATWYYLPPHL